MGTGAAAGSGKARVAAAARAITKRGMPARLLELVLSGKSAVATALVRAMAAAMLGLAFDMHLHVAISVILAGLARVELPRNSGLFGYVADPCHLLEVRILCPECRIVCPRRRQDDAVSQGEGLPRTESRRGKGQISS